MARCPRGSDYDEGGFCSCGAGHEDPDMVKADRARLTNAPEQVGTPCGRCGKPLEQHGFEQMLRCYPDTVVGGGNLVH